MGHPSHLVTGSSGFIGSSLVTRLVESGHRVVGLDVRAPTVTHPLFRHVACDVSDASRLFAALDEATPDCIIHLAAVHDLADPLNERRGLSSYQSNIDSVRNLLAWLERGHGEQRVIFASTQLVNQIGHVQLDPLLCTPDTFYGESKLVGEKLVSSVADARFTWTIIRPTTIWGPGMSSHYQRFLGYIRDGRYWHPGTEPLWKSYGFIGNTVHQIVRLLEVPKEFVHKKTFYIADYEPLSLHRYACRLAFHLNAPPVRSMALPLLKFGASIGTVITYTGWRTFPLTRRRLRNMLTEYRVDTSDLQKVVGPLPYSFEDGVIATARWYRGLCSCGPVLSSSL